MTIIEKAEIVCSVCNTRIPIMRALSCFCSGSSDTDCRPPAGLRSLIFERVHECPCCGYISKNLEEKPARPDFLKSWRYTRFKVDRNKRFSLWGSREYGRKYKKLDKMIILPYEASKFYRYSLLVHGNLEEHFYAMRNAAWACDDGDNLDEFDFIFGRKRRRTKFELKVEEVYKKMAMRFRKMALKDLDKLLPLVKAKLQKLDGKNKRDYHANIKKLEEFTICRFDFLRRTGMFTELEGEYEAILKAPLANPEHMKLIAAIYKWGVEEHDTDRHTCGEALGDASYKI